MPYFIEYNIKTKILYYHDTGINLYSDIKGFSIYKQLNHFILYIILSGIAIGTDKYHIHNIYYICYISGTNNISNIDLI